MFYYLYVLKSFKDNKIYIGKTKNLKQRLKNHLRGNVKATKSRIPLKLIYYEVYTNKEQWSKQEKFYKSGIGRDTLKYKL
jgi:putative endonuclease